MAEKTLDKGVQIGVSPGFLFSADQIFIFFLSHQPKDRALWGGLTKTGCKSSMLQLQQTLLTNHLGLWFYSSTMSQCSSCPDQDLGLAGALVRALAKPSPGSNICFLCPICTVWLLAFVICHLGLPELLHGSSSCGLAPAQQFLILTATTYIFLRQV